MVEKRLAVRFLAMKSPLYLTENLQGGQLPPVQLWRWHVGILSQKMIINNKLFEQNLVIADLKPTKQHD